MTIAVKVGEAKGTLRRYVKDTLELELDAPFAPGTPLTVEVEGMRLDVKSMGSRKRDGVFHLRAQLRTLTRHDRKRLEALVLEA